MSQYDKIYVIMNEMEVKNLIIRAKAGDTEAFGRVFSEYLTPIYRYIYFRVKDKESADDLTQEVFIRIFNSLDRVTISSQSPLTYFYTVARNLLIDSYRKKRIETMGEEEAEDKLVETNNPEKITVLKDDIASLKDALRRISESEADALVLRFIDEHSNKEIGQIMGKSEEAVRQLQSRGLKSLRSIINKKDFF